MSVYDESWYPHVVIDQMVKALNEVTEMSESRLYWARRQAQLTGAPHAERVMLYGDTLDYHDAVFRMTRKGGTVGAVTRRINKYVRTGGQPSHIGAVY